MRKYCEECGKEVGTKVIKKKEIYDVCGEPIEVYAQILVPRCWFVLRVEKNSIVKNLITLL